MSDARIPPPLLRDFVLVDTLTAPQQVQIQTLTQTIPRPRRLFLTLSGSLDNPQKLAEQVNSDPEIGVKLLQIVNSSYFSLPNEITSIRHAVVYLGTAMVRDIAMQAALREVLTIDPEVERYYQQLWVSSVIASALCTQLATTLQLDNACSLATRALLSSLGSFTLIANTPDFAPVYSHNLLERTKMEQGVFGVNSAAVGAVLAKCWELPDSIGYGMRHQLTPMAKPIHAAEIDAKILPEVVLCFICCHIGDLVACHQLEDVGEVDLLASEDISLFYLPEYLTAAELVQLPEYLHAPQVRDKLNRTIQQIARQF